ncbi:MAG: spore protease YyaC [Clostridia bacterium]|nr:spore protease YyaC [Clostridia bacterium]
MALPVILCIGSNQVMGDSLGPKVGDLLRDKYNTPAYVYGGINHPVNGVNYYEYYCFLKKTHPKSLIIAVDACVGNPEDVGKIKYSALGLKAGEALSKNLPRVGDIGVLGVVCARSKDNLRALMSCERSFIANMSEKIAYNISRFISIPAKKEIL